MTRWRPLATLFISLCGLGLAAFLTYGHYFDQAAITTTCPMGTKGGLINCGLVTTSPESVIFGIPVALYGLAFFLAMVGLCLPAAWRSGSEWIAKGRLLANLVGMGFVLYLVSVELLQVHAICIYCTCVHLLQFALFLLVLTGWYDTGYAARLYEGETGEATSDSEGSLVA